VLIYFGFRSGLAARAAGRFKAPEASAFGDVMAERNGKFKR
jgi:hypothetical protein